MKKLPITCGRCGEELPDKVKKGIWVQTKKSFFTRKVRNFIYGEDGNLLHKCEKGTNIV